MLHRPRDKICSILVTSRPVGDAVRRVFASNRPGETRLAPRSTRALAEGDHSRTTPSGRGHRANDYRMSGRRDAEQHAAKCYLIASSFVKNG